MVNWSKAARLGIATLAISATGWVAGADDMGKALVAGQVMPGELGLSIGQNSLRGLGALDLNDLFRGYAKSGARWVRVDLNWSEVQAAGPDSYDWSVMDSYVALARSLDLRLLPVVSFSPAWLDGGASPANPKAVAAYAKFLGEAVNRYSPQGIRAWEIWNEPNLAGAWAPAPDPVAYAGLLVAAYASVKAADDAALVISGGLSPAARTGSKDGKLDHIAAVDFLGAMYDAGAAGSFDALGFHPYSWPRMPDT